MANDFRKQQVPNLSGLSSIAKSLLRQKIGTDAPSEFGYHVLATMHIVGLATVLAQDSANSEWFKFFYQNGYATNLIVKAHGKELGITEFAALQYGNSTDKVFREELAEIVRYSNDLNFPSHNNTLLALLSYDKEQNVKYGYGSILGTGTVTVNKGGKYKIAQHLI
ncbi:MAG TPA: hypothetical protein VNF06_02515 [Candidatus Aquilonibacter sp.]|nr:hypothetical protein [Candidatus Aquilonibacter sp.]